MFDRGLKAGRSFSDVSTAPAAVSPVLSRLQIAVNRKDSILILDKEDNIALTMTAAGAVKTSASKEPAFKPRQLRRNIKIILTWAVKTYII